MQRIDKRTIERRLFMTIFAVMLSFMFGCVDKPDKPLRIGLSSWPGYEFLYLAQEKGFYREEGVDVKLLEFSSLSDVRRAYERGQIDGLGTSVVDVLQARDSSSRSPQIIQIIDYSNGADVILGKLGIENMIDLRGSHIAVELGSLGVYVLSRGLEISGLTLADVKMTAMDQISMEEAISKGALDAIVSYPPTSIKLTRDAKVTTLFSTAEIPGEVVDVIAVDDQIIKQRSSDIGKLMRAYHKALQYARQYPDEAYRIMSAREGVSPNEFLESINRGIYIVSQEEQAEFFLPGGKLEKVIDTVDRILRQNGQINGPDRREGVANGLFALQETGK